MASCWRRVYRFCASFQVELRGNYSAERIETLRKYLQSASTLRSLFFCALSPLPCVLLVALVDCVPLASPQAGSSANVVFWVRDFVSIALMTRAVLEQIRVFVPGLNMTPIHAAVMTLLACTAAESLTIGLSSVVGFPVPFSLVVGVPAWIFSHILSFGFFYSSKLRRDAALRNDLQNFINALNCPIILMFVYPVYLYGFGRVGGLGQNFTLIVLALIRIIAKNWTSYFLDTKYDLMPQLIIFNVDVFNSMYVSISIQNSKSSSVIFLSVALDAFLAWIAISDVENLMKSVVMLRRKIPVDDPLKSTSFIDIAAQIIRMDDRARVQLSQRRYASGLAVLRQADSDDDNGPPTGPIAAILAVSSTRRIVPIGGMLAFTEVEAFEPPSSEPKTSQQNGLDKVLPENERQQLVHRSARVLFTTEFAILVLYTKCIVPFVVAICTAVQYYLPNHDYYPQLMGLDETSVMTKVRVVLILGAIQLVLLLVNGFILQRRLGISMLQLLAFVLDHGRIIVQSNLFLSIFYTIQNSLEHNGSYPVKALTWIQPSHSNR